jgi:hypothetical protein
MTLAKSRAVSGPRIFLPLAIVTSEDGYSCPQPWDFTALSDEDHTANWDDAGSRVRGRSTMKPHILTGH